MSSDIDMDGCFVVHCSKSRTNANEAYTDNEGETETQSIDETCSFHYDKFNVILNSQNLLDVFGNDV